MTMRKPNMKEMDLQAAVIDLARHTGWYTQHSRRAHVARQDGSTYHATPISGDTGFPDLVLVHKNRPNMFIVELKSDTGRLSPAQKRWGERLAHVAEYAPSVRTGVVYPDQWRDGTIRDLLLRGWEPE